MASGAVYSYRAVNDDSSDLLHEQLGHLQRHHSTSAPSTRTDDPSRTVEDDLEDLLRCLAASHSVARMLTSQSVPLRVLRPQRSDPRLVILPTTELPVKHEESPREARARDESHDWETLQVGTSQRLPSALPRLVRGPSPRSISSPDSPASFSDPRATPSSASPSKRQASIDVDRRPTTGTSKSKASAARPRSKSTSAATRLRYPPTQQPRLSSSTTTTRSTSARDLTKGSAPPWLDSTTPALYRSEDGSISLVGTPENQIVPAVAKRIWQQQLALDCSGGNERDDDDFLITAWNPDGSPKAASAVRTTKMAPRQENERLDMRPSITVAEEPPREPPPPPQVPEKVTTTHERPARPSADDNHERTRKAEQDSRVVAGQEATRQHDNDIDAHRAGCCGCIMT